MFRVGQKVICVDAGRVVQDRRGNYIDVTDIVENSIYTVRWVGRYEDHPCVRLVGIYRDADIHGIARANPDCPLKATRFRPITDISIFTEILRRESAPSSLPLAEA